MGTDLFVGAEKRGGLEIGLKDTFSPYPPPFPPASFFVVLLDLNSFRA